MLAVGVLLCVPRLVLSWLVLPSAYDLTSIIFTLALVAGVLVLALAAIRLWLLRSKRLVPVVAIGLAAVAVAGVLVHVFPPGNDAVAYSGSLFAEPSRALQLTGYLLIGALSQFGVFLVIGGLALALNRFRTARAR